MKAINALAWSVGIVLVFVGSGWFMLSGLDKGSESGLSKNVAQRVADGVLEDLAFTREQLIIQEERHQAEIDGLNEALEVVSEQLFDEMGHGLYVWDHPQLLMHFDGVDGDTTTIDN